MIDESLARFLHVESLRNRDLHPEHDPEVLFQSSTIGALLEGAFDGDVSLAELAEHGDLGIGTINGLDGEMIAVDGCFYRADVDGMIEEPAPSTRTPFAAVAWFEPSVEIEIDGPIGLDALLARLDEIAGGDESACALRIDGEFEFVRARSVPRQQAPYRPLAEVLEEQSVFELVGSGTIVGFRFPDYANGLEVGGYHLHFISADRSRGGHVLECTAERLSAQFDFAGELHVELPPGIELDSAQLDAATAAVLAGAERGQSS